MLPFEISRRRLIYLAVRFRVEQLYPFPDAEIEAALARYSGAARFVWAQEEPRNMGGWTFVADRLAPLLARTGRGLGYVGRPRAAAPATGSMKRHQASQDQLVREALDATDREPADGKPVEA